MELTSKLLTEVSRNLDLPSDIIMGVPRIEILGQDQIHVEPHRGLLSYSQTEVVINSKLGNICVSGNNLRIKLMNHVRIVLDGHITNVSIQGDGI